MSSEGRSRVVDSRTVYKGKILGLDVQKIELPGGKRTDFELVQHPGAAAVVMVTEGNEVLLLNHYRHAAGGWLTEIPAGKLSPGEEPAACARRECGEETGFEPRELSSLGWIWTTPGFSNEKIWLFAGRDLMPVRRQLEGDEVLEVESVPLELAVEMARNGELTDAKSICALLRVSVDSECSAARAQQSLAEEADGPGPREVRGLGVVASAGRIGESVPCSLVDIDLDRRSLRL